MDDHGMTNAAGRGQAQPGTGALKRRAFAPDEYRRRLANVQSLLQHQGFDALLCTTPARICYLTGYESVAVGKFWLALVPAEGQPVLLIEDFESHNATVTSWLKATSTFGIGEDAIEATARLVHEHGLARKRLGVELDRLSTLSAGDYVRLKDLLAEARLIDATALVDGVRAIKSEAEIDYLRRAGKISAGAMNAAIAAAREGATDNDIAAAGYQTLYALGSEYMCYPWFVTVGPRSGIPHTTFRRIALGPGDPVFLEVGGCICRYSSPLMRTAVIGGPTDTLRRMADACIDSVNTMIQHIRPGATGDQVAQHATRAMGKLPDDLVWHGYFSYSVGLGFGPTWGDCQQCMIMLGSQTVLEPGMVFHANTSLRNIGQCGAAFSETVVVTADGCEILTEGCPRELANAPQSRTFASLRSGFELIL